ncbi:MAG: elongation factor P hydroxylase [Myxococcales bacterium]|nr:elongation factor P hydroxylase [Myxococcales bacterium]
MTAARTMTELPRRAEQAQLEEVFERCFFASHRTRLVGGGDEPIYLPADEPGGIARVVYRHDYVASALHEVAHWCIAGARRRRLVDYGYWYAPDGRSAEQQAIFERVEVHPQALEWIFADAWGSRFELSADNLQGDARPSPRFARAVQAEKARLLTTGLAPRAARFLAALSQR